LATRQQIPRFTSDLAKVEVVRACRRFNEDIIADASQLLAGLTAVPLTPEILDRAALVGPPLLRSLDAIHLSSALSLRAEISAFVTYDQRLGTAAISEDLPVVAPS
jgi:predicted nucleic acid-binding protein